MNKALGTGVIVVLAIGLVTSYANVRSLKKANEELAEEAESLKGQSPVVAKDGGKSGPEVTLDPAELARVIGENHDLSEKIKALEARLGQVAKVEATEDGAEKSAEAKKDVPRRDWNSRRNDYMAELKENDPEKYKELQERRTKMRDHVTNTMERQSAFILNLDESKMTEDQLANHKALTGLMERNWELMELAGNDADPAAQGEARGELMKNVFSMGGLLEKEREVALQSMGSDIGYDAGESAEFSAAVQDVYKMTSLRSYMPEGMGRGWGRGGRKSRGDKSGGDSSKAPEGK